MATPRSRVASRPDTRSTNKLSLKMKVGQRQRVQYDTQTETERLRLRYRDRERQRQIYRQRERLIIVEEMFKLSLFPAIDLITKIVII